jgi:hypothetical protein
METQAFGEEEIRVRARSIAVVSDISIRSIFPISS